MQNHKILKKITLLSLGLLTLSLCACGHNIRSPIKSNKLINTQNKNKEFSLKTKIIILSHLLHYQSVKKFCILFQIEKEVLED